MAIQKMDNSDVLARQQAILSGTPYVVTKQFPWKLHEMLAQAELDGDTAIARGCRVDEPSGFTNQSSLLTK